MLPARRVLSLLALALWTAAPASAQTPLAFDQAVARALERSPSIRAARARTEQAAAGVSAARAAWFPRVTFAETAHRGNQPVFVFSALLSSRRFGSANLAVDALNHPGALTFYQRTLGLEQVLFDGGRTLVAGRTARLRQDSADLALRQEAADLVVALAGHYGRALAADAQQRAAAAAVTAASEDLLRAERQRDAGRATDADVLAMSAHLADVRQREIQAAGEAAAARAQTNGLIGAPATAAFAAIEPTLRPVRDVELAALVAEAESARAEVERALAGERLAEQAASSARAEWWPRVLGRVAVESNGLSYGERATGWAAGVDLQWSLSLGGAELARTRAAAADLSEARARVDEARSAAAADVVAARERQRSARARLEVGRAAVDQARESERIFRDRYQAGLASVNDLLRASSLVLEAETARIGALVDAFVADVQLDRATGRDPFENR
jgi:outer membrane protein TolC